MKRFPEILQKYFHPLTVFFMDHVHPQIRVDGIVAGTISRDLLALRAVKCGDYFSLYKVNTVKILRYFAYQSGAEITVCNSPGVVFGLIFAGTEIFKFMTQDFIIRNELFLGYFISIHFIRSLCFLRLSYSMFISIQL